MGGEQSDELLIESEQVEHGIIGRMRRPEVLGRWIVVVADPWIKLRMGHDTSDQFRIARPLESNHC